MRQLTDYTSGTHSKPGPGQVGSQLPSALQAGHHSSHSEVGPWQCTASPHPQHRSSHGWTPHPSHSLYMEVPLRLCRPRAMVTDEAVTASVSNSPRHGLSRMSRLQCRLMLSNTSSSSITSPTTATSSSWQARDQNEHLSEVGHPASEGRALLQERLHLSPRLVAGQGSKMDLSQLQQADCRCHPPKRLGHQLR